MRVRTGDVRTRMKANGRRGQDRTDNPPGKSRVL